MKDRVCIGSLIVIGMVAIGGCASINRAINPIGSMAEATQGVLTHLADGAVLDEMLAKMSGNLQNPGVEGYTNIRISQGIRAVGANGRIDLDANAKGTGIAADLRASLLERLADPGVTADDKRAIMAILQAHNVLPKPIVDG